MGLSVPLIPGDDWKLSTKNPPCVVTTTLDLPAQQKGKKFAFAHDADGFFSFPQGLWKKMWKI